MGMPLGERPQVINVRDYLFNGRNRYVVTAASDKDDEGNDAGAAVLPLVTLAKDDMNKQKKTPPTPGKPLIQ